MAGVVWNTCFDAFFKSMLSEAAVYDTCAWRDSCLKYVCVLRQQVCGGGSSGPHGRLRVFHEVHEADSDAAGSLAPAPPHNLACDGDNKLPRSFEINLVRYITLDVRVIDGDRNPSLTSDR